MSTITNLAISNVKKNKTRTILIIISVLLTTVLLTIIGSVGYGLLESGRVNAGKLYGDYAGTYSRVTEEQLQEMKKHSEFRDIGLSYYVGQVENQKADMSLYWYDDMAQKASNMQDILETGVMPQAENEITAQKEFFQQLGTEQPKVGDKVNVSLRTDNRSKYQTKEFVISGILASNKASSLQTSFSANVSEQFYENLIPEGQRSYNVSFQVIDSVGINADNGEEVLKELAGKCGIDERNVTDNMIYLIYRYDPGMETIMGCLMIALLVIFMSVVVIYNIFQAGIIQKIQEYGKIKALGATRRQMKALIFREGMLIALGGIIIGIPVGTSAASVIFQFVIEAQRDDVTGIKNLESVSIVSVPVLALVAVMTLAAVWLALKRPMSIVASISPVEAVRYEENVSRKKTVRKGRKEISVRGMTMANLSANRKRTIRTICTMGLSCVLFVTLSSLAGNMDSEYDVRKMIEHGRFVINLDYSMNDAAYPENNLDNIQKENLLGKELQEKISQIPGVTGVTSRIMTYATEENQGKEEPTRIMVLNREDFENEANQGGTIGNVSYDEISKKNGIIFGWSHFLEENGYSLNQDVTFRLPNGGETISFQAELMGCLGSVDADWIMTEDTWKSLGIAGEPVSTLWIDCEEQGEQEVKKALDNLLMGMEHVRMTSYKDSMELANMQMKMMQGAIYGMLAILGVIGFMNMANTIITGVVTRKRELGILQATGMTKRQLNWMLQLEGIIFSFGTIIVSLVVGTPLGYALFRYCREQAFYGLNEYHVPVLEMAVMILTIIALQAILSFVLSRNLQKESLVERINYQG